MKHSLIFALYTFSALAHVGPVDAENVRTFAIVTASSLRCRSGSSTDSAIIAAYPFGTIIEVAAISNNADKDEWVRQKAPSCWLRKEYLLLSNAEEGSITELRPEEYHCIGTEGTSDYPFYLIGKHYIHPIAVFSSVAPSPQLKIIEIGTFWEENGNFRLSAIERATYDPAGYLMSIKKIDHQLKLELQTDLSGPYLKIATHQMSRQVAKKRCQENPVASTENGLWEVFYHKKTVAVSSINSEVNVFRTRDIITKEQWQVELEQCRRNPTYKCPL